MGIKPLGLLSCEKIQTDKNKTWHWGILLALVFSHTAHAKIQKVWQKDLTEHCLSWSSNKYFFNDFHNMFWKSLTGPAFALTHCWLAIKRKHEKTKPELVLKGPHELVWVGFRVRPC